MFDYNIPMDKYYMYYLKDLNQPEIPIESSPYTMFSNTKSYLDKYPDNKNYVPQLSSSLESLLPDKKTSGNDVSDIIMQEKQQFLSASVQHLKDQLSLRTKIFHEHMYYIDYKIVQCESYLLNIRDFWPYINRGVETKRANLGHLISRLESEKRQETVRWWGDQVKVEAELLKTIGDYQGAKRRYRFLSGE